MFIDAKFFMGAFSKFTRGYLQVYNSLREQWQPATPGEELLVERMAIALCKLAFLEPVEERQLFLWADFKNLGYIWPHQARLERGYDKALTQLRSLQKDRAPKPHDEPAVSLQKPATPATRPLPSPQCTAGSC